MRHSGLEEDFNTIVVTHLPMVVAYARKRLPGKNNGDAEDFANEAFLNFWNYIVKLGYIPKIANMGAFLRVILLNVIRAHFRKKQSIFDLSKTKLDAILPVYRDLGHEDDGLVILEQVELRYELLRYIDQLPPVQHTCITLRYINELEYKEIALFLNTSVNNVRVNTYRGIKRLREIYPRQKEGE